MDPTQLSLPGAPEAQDAAPAPAVDVAGYDPAKEVADTHKKFGEWARARRPFEGAWFVSAAFLRGQQKVEYNDALGRLITPALPASRISLSINRILPKVKARLAKFFKNRPRPVVIPASAEHEDVLNARATEQFLTYQWYRTHMEEKYRDARLWATVASKGFLTVRWDEGALGKTRTMSPEGQPVDDVVPIGDIEIEVASPFEIYPADNAIASIGKQPEWMRAKLRQKDEVQQRYPALQKLDRDDDAREAGTSSQRTLDRISTLNKRQNDVTGGNAAAERAGQVLVLEHFIAPCGKYPKGRYKVIVGQEVAKIVDELPFGMADHPDNPYPIVEISDSVTAGQFWNTTLVEQLIDLQREYNFVRGMISENLRLTARPKMVFCKQHNLADGAYTTAPGEILEITWIPGLPMPFPLTPPNIAADAWQLLALINREFDDLTLIYPSSVGKTGDASSGYQTNLLQEAADSVHAPDIRNDELAIQDLSWKIRRLAKLTYTAPRLIAVLGANSAPSVQAFSQNQIDEFAEVRIQAGSMLPDLKSARIQMITTMFKDGLFGNGQEPAVRRKVLNLIEMGGIETVQEDERADSDEAHNEELQMSEGVTVPPATFYQEHPDHLFVHQNELKSSHFKTLKSDVQRMKIAHTITHYDWLNPAMAWGLRQQYGFVGPNDLPVATPPQPPAPPMPVGPDGTPLAASSGPAQPQATPPASPAAPGA